MNFVAGLVLRGRFRVMILGVRRGEERGLKSVLSAVVTLWHCRRDSVYTIYGDNWYTEKKIV